MKKAVIDRLKKEAQTVVGEGLGGNYYAMDEDKLIELVVKECAKVAWRHTPDYEELDYSHLISNKIKEHFGINDD